MKKLFTLVFSLLAVNFMSFSQSTIDNQSFENWSQIVVKDSIEHWNSSTLQYQINGININNSYQVGSAQDGNYAMHLETLFQYDSDAGENDTVMAFVMKSEVDDNDNFIGFPYTDTVDIFKAWYKCNTIASDSAVVIINLSKNGAIYSSISKPIGGVVSTWTELTIALPLASGTEPDSVFIGFVSSYFIDNTINEEGNWIEVDNISFEFSAGSTIPSVIPNHSFENIIQETIEQPSDWWSFDQLLVNQSGSLYVTKSTDAIVGTTALRIETNQAIIDAGVPAIVTNGRFSFEANGFVGGDPYVAQPDEFSFQYKYSTLTTDTAFVLLDVWKDGLATFADSIGILLTAANWTTHSISLNMPQAPDSMRVSFFSGDSLGSVLLVDDIQFSGGDLGFDKNNSQTLNIYPNPANNSFKIINQPHSTIHVYAINGELIFNTTAESNQTIIDSKLWRNGVYFVSIIHNGTIETKKINVIH